MRVSFLTDLHLEEAPGTGQIYERQSNVLRQILEHDDLKKTDLFLLGGDNSGPMPPHKSTPAERNAHIAFRRALSDIAPIIEVQGNHDYPGDYEVFNKLRTKHPVHFISEPTVIDTNGLEAWGDIDCVVACLPWIFVSEAGGGNLQSYVGDVVKALQERATKMRETDGDHARPYFLLGHCAVDGALVREGQPKISTKDATLDPKGLLPVLERKTEHGSQVYLLFDGGFFGHYHHRQVVRHWGHSPVGIYGGSLFVGEYGESVDKGWTSYDHNAPANDRFTFHVVSQSPKVLIDYDPKADSLISKPDLEIDAERLHEVDFDEIDVKLQVRIPHSGLEPFRENFDRVRAAIAKTASSLVVKFVGEVHEPTRRGAKAVAAARTTEDKIRNFLVHHNPRPSHKVVDEVVSLFQKIRADVDGRS